VEWPRKSSTKTKRPKALIWRKEIHMQPLDLKSLIFF
jgi:hypothetical protein